jgi:hypothetical protein
VKFNQGHDKVVVFTLDHILESLGGRAFNTENKKSPRPSPLSNSN